MSPSLVTKLYRKQIACLHTEKYLIWDKNLHQTFCGPCFFRDGIQTEVPTRLTIREGSGLFGAPQYDPKLIKHVTLVMGIVPPEPGESLRAYRQRRKQMSWPSPKQYPFTSALWQLMGVQPPLARVLVKFCEGKSELDIARQMDLSLYNVQERLRKSVHTGQKFLRL